MNKPARIIDGKSWIWFAEYGGRPAAERHAFRVRMRGAFVRVIKSKDGFDLYARNGRRHNRPKP